MAALCSRSEHCESEIRQKLQRAAIAASDIDDIIDRLREADFINDARYCSAFSRDKMRFAGWGRRKIAYALSAKRLPQSEIQQALAALDADEYMAVARRVAAARERFGGEREALMRHMLSRGFTVDEAQQAICTDA